MIDKSSRKQRLGSYLLEFQAEPSRFHKGVRYHWIISLAHKPDQLVSAGLRNHPRTG
jgi:predicted transposase YbfD/YdcC